MPSTDVPSIDLQSQSDIVRLTAILMFVEETHDNDIVRGWAGKLLAQIQADATLTEDDVAGQQTDVDRIMETVDIELNAPADD